MVSACVDLGDASDATVDDDGPEVALAAGSPHAINIGFNGPADQFTYADLYFAANTGAPGPRLCHTYVRWNLSDEAPNGDPTVAGSRAYLADWLAHAAGHCDEALLSFKTDVRGSPPTEAEYKRAFTAFLAIPWAANTGFTGSFAFTPWNEPNNGGDAGDGLGAAIPPQLAAHYFLMMTRLCESSGCKVAAGDFASNGNMWNDFEWNCANDNVAPSALCRYPSPENTTHAPASYLDHYKNTIANAAASYGLGSNYRPKYFAFHGWHDVNEYLATGNHCDSYGDCASRRILRALGGSWGGVELWDTEVGMGQNGAVTDDAGGCGAAFLLRLSTLSRRITRVYDTRLHGGTLELFTGQTPRPALLVLAHRDTSYAAGRCQ